MSIFTKLYFKDLQVVLAKSSYVGAYVGTQYNKQEFTIGEMSFYDKQWQFAALSEIGFIYKLNNYIDINSTVSFLQTARANDFMDSLTLKRVLE